MNGFRQLMFLLGLVVMMWIPLASANVLELHTKYLEEEDMSLVEHDSQRISRRLQALSKATFFPMQGAVSDGIYYVRVYVGNPPKEYFMDVDTGSDLTWLQCDAPCQKCAKGPHQWYKPQQLTPTKDPLCDHVRRTSRNKHDSSKQCDYDIEYVDGGVSLGVLVTDTVVIQLSNKTLAKSKSTFGCGYHQEGPLAISPAATDGVLGLGAGIVSLPSQWTKQGLIKNVIGLCIAGGGKKGGYMFFGEDYVPTSGMTWVPMLPGRKHYTVGAAQIIVGNKLLVKEGDEKRLGEFIFDTGSSYTYFTKQAYVPFLTAIRESIGKRLEEDSTEKYLPVCWKGKKRLGSVADVASYFKPLTLNFKITSPHIKNAKFEAHPEDYLIISPKGNVCLGILDGSEVCKDGNNILGDISLQEHLVIYNNDNKQIGWMRTDCSKQPKSVIRRRALEDSPQSYGEETISCSQDLGQAVCPSSSYFLAAQ